MYMSPRLRVVKTPEGVLKRGIDVSCQGPVEDRERSIYAYFENIVKTNKKTPRLPCVHTGEKGVWGYWNVTPVASHLKRVLRAVV